MKITQAGTRSVSEHNTLNTKVILSNRLSLLLSFVPLVFSLLSYFYFPDIFWIPFAGLIAFPLTLLFNSISWHFFARFWLCVSPVFIGQLFYAAVSQGNHDPLIGIKINIFGFLTLPFILFDARERKGLVISFGTSTVIFMAYPLFNHWIDLEINNGIIQDLEWLAVLFGVVVMAITLFSMAQVNTSNFIKTQSVMQQISSQNEQLRKNEQQLQQVINEVEKARAEDKKREWAIRGQARISHILREHQQSATLYQQLISSIANHLHIQQAAIYITTKEETGELLQLVACYACPESKLREEKFSTDDNLVGQCFKDEKTIHLKKIPDNYIQQIQSGLGKAQPRSLLLVPIKKESQKEGVIEIASFQHIEDYKIEFLNKVGENLASSLANIRLNQQTQELLKDTQHQAKSMQVKQELIEALKADTDLLLNNIQGLVLLYKYEMPNQWHLKFVNESIERVSGYSSEEFIRKGYNRSTLLPDNNKEDIEHYISEMLLVAVKTRQPCQLNYHIVNLEGEEIEVLERGTFIYDNKGNPTHYEGVIIEL